VDRTLFQSNDSSVQLSLMTDYVRAINESSGDDLPRTPPLRIGSKLGLEHGAWTAGIEARYAIKQNNTGPDESSTDGYLQLNLDLSRRIDLRNNLTATLFLRADNLLDQEIRYSTSYLKDEAPLPGIHFTIGSRIEF
jgi:iron complex outermembrane receptor protein